jgi:hypothetical protein
MSIENVKANAALCREEHGLGRKLNFLACAIEELANTINDALIIPGSLPPEPKPEPTRPADAS